MADVKKSSEEKKDLKASSRTTDTHNSQLPSVCSQPGVQACNGCVSFIIIIRLHRIHIAYRCVYCYSRIDTRVVCACLCVRHELYPAKTVGPIEMSFGVWAWVGPSNHVLDGGSDHPQGKGPSHSKV